MLAEGDSMDCLLDPAVLVAIAAVIGACATLLAELRKWRR
jgi:hypothetical protein